MTGDEYQPVAVSRRICAPARDIFRVLADPGRHREFDGSGMLRGVASSTTISGVGDVFVMKMYFDELGDYQMINHVVEYQPDRRIGWEPEAGRGHPNAEPGAERPARWGQRWSFELTPDGPDATTVTEIFDCSQVPEDQRPDVGHGAIWAGAMARTLERLDALCTRQGKPAQSSVGKGAEVPKRSGAPAEDPFGGRQPTSHERLTGLPWDASYRDGPAPWDSGRPQPAVVRVAAQGGFAGTVLDAGCGTGENALHLASLGLPVLGVDVAETALAIARAKAAEREIEAEFAVADALALGRLGRRFDTVLDCGLFHTFDGGERPGYVVSLASVTGHGGTLYVLCFSDQGPGTGPHPVSQEELRSAFGPGAGWHVAAIKPDRVQTRFHDDEGAPAWLATIKRT